MDFLQAIILGVVEGVTEFLPVSSTGHLILTARALGMHQSEFLKSFEIVIQCGAILSVAALYWRPLITDRAVIKRVITAFLPTAVLGLILYKVVKRFFLASHGLVLWSLFLGGIFLILFELIHRERKVPDAGISSIPYGTAFLIGVFQSLAMIPGVSRSAATIVGGLALGVRRRTIVEFSFLLAVPTMLAAAGLDLVKSSLAFTPQQCVFLAAGFATSFAVALASIKFLLSFIQGHNFVPFGVYRIILALLFWAVV